MSQVESVTVVILKIDYQLEGYIEGLLVKPFSEVDRIKFCKCGPDVYSNELWCPPILSLLEAVLVQVSFQTPESSPEFEPTGKSCVSCGMNVMGAISSFQL